MEYMATTLDEIGATGGAWGTFSLAFGKKRAIYCSLRSKTPPPKRKSAYFGQKHGPLST
jgi:hypothetical protein